MTDIYAQFDRAFSRVQAGVILKDGAPAGRYAVRYPRDGMGRATFYLQAWGSPMVKGSASGCGYDKTTAAAHYAGHALVATIRRGNAADFDEKDAVALEIGAALAGDSDGGYGWETRLREAGYTVAFAI
jgi:hypothetical protein